MNKNGPHSANELPFGLAEALRDQVRRHSERDEMFWSAQRARIRARVRTQVPHRRPLGLALAGALILFLAVWLTSPAGPGPQAIPPSAAGVDDDQQLLIAVERALASGTPQSLAPLSPFAQPDSKSNETQTIPHKEHGNED